MRNLLELLALVATPLATRAQEAKQPSFANPFPTLTLRDGQGQEHSLSSLHGKIVVLNFWATWCAPCREEMPLLVSLQKRSPGVLFRPFPSSLQQP